MLVDDEHPYNCARHNQDNLLCLNCQDKIKIEYNPGGKIESLKMMMTKDNYDEVFEAVREKNDEAGALGGPLPDYIIMRQLSICPRFMFTEEMYTALEYYNICNGLNVKTPQELDQQSALWIDVCNIFNDEINKWVAVKQQQQQQKQMDK